MSLTLILSVNGKTLLMTEFAFAFLHVANISTVFFSTCTCTLGSVYTAPHAVHSSYNLEEYKGFCMNWLIQLVHNAYFEANKYVQVHIVPQIGVYPACYFHL